MTPITRLFLILVAALVAARPVMACCVTDQAAGGPPDQRAELEIAPCHGPPAATLGQHDSAVSDECPDCPDCESAMMQADALAEAASPTGSADDAPAAAPPAFDAFEVARTLQKTGPPSPAPRPRSTPISLKQRLLI